VRSPFLRCGNFFFQKFLYFRLPNIKRFLIKHSFFFQLLKLNVYLDIFFFQYIEKKIGGKFLKDFNVCNKDLVI
jgi:hypothetical protein